MFEILPFFGMKLVVSRHPFSPRFSVKNFVTIAKKIAEEPKVTQFFGTFWSGPKKFTTVHHDILSI